mmetsp:Transcript_78239/g.135722  ORF Transcript_78239/g.135722 Transcript_78239/m.135722 type:complete len:318 (-) Transcript_78239:244-1197(-)
MGLDHVALDVAGSTSSSSPVSTKSDSASLTEVTDRGALMLPEPDVSGAAPHALPALPIAAAMTAKPKPVAPPVLEAMEGVAVPAKVTPRGSLVALGDAPKQPMAEAAAVNVSPVKGRQIGRQIGRDPPSLHARAECAEQEVKKLRVEVRKWEAEVRKLRAEAYFNRIAKQVQAPRSADGMNAGKELFAETRGCIDASTADAWTAKALAEERAVKAEAEVLRLHTELQACRIQFALLTENTTTSAPPPDPESQMEASEPSYDAATCLQYMCGCLWFYLWRTVMLIFFCRCPCRSRRAMALKGEDSAATPVKAFSEDRA